MNEELENKTSNDLILVVKEIEAEYQAIKNRMLKDYDTMVELDKKYVTVNEIIMKRLKGN